jgi:UDP-3-O-[3-hydroxymyristoyl] glucosamine N-acyltransferase LpxD
MGANIRQFLLKDLLQSIPPESGKLVLEVRDPGHLTEVMAISGGRSFELATETEMVFCKDDDRKRRAALLTSTSRFIILMPAVADGLPEPFSATRVLIITEKPRLLMALLLRPFGSDEAVMRQRRRISGNAKIAAGVRLGPGVVIGPDTEIGHGCAIGPNTVIDHARIGADTSIGANCTIGFDSFGYEIDDVSGMAVKLVHFGLVHIGDHVEILSNACICRGSLHDTTIEDHVKIGHLVNVGHNVLIKRGSLITGSDVLGGSSVVGESAWLAPSTTLMNGISFGAKSMSGLGAVVIGSVGDNEVVAGVPARKLRNRYGAPATGRKK